MLDRFNEILAEGIKIASAAYVEQPETWERYCSLFETDTFKSATEIFIKGVFLQVSWDIMTGKMTDDDQEALLRHIATGYLAGIGVGAEIALSNDI